MTKHHPHDYLPATGLRGLLPAYDLIARVLGFRRVYARLISQAELRDGQRVLEIGCGTGNVLIKAKRSAPGIDAIGSDPDPQILNRARRKTAGWSRIRFEQAYAQRLPYADGEFDRVLSSMMLHHIGEDAKTAVAEEVYRVLRPGGRLHLVDIGGDEHSNRNPGDAIPRLLAGAGFDCARVAVQPHRLLGQLSYFQATRPA